MARLIELHDKKTGSDGRGRYLAFDLIDILRLIEPEGQQQTWAVSYLDGQGDFTNVLPAFGQGGVVFLTWEELVAFAPGVKQIYWGYFVGGTIGKLQEITPTMEDSEIYSRSVITIEAFDSNFWRFFAHDDALVNRVAQGFKDVIEVSLSLLQTSQSPRIAVRYNANASQLTVLGNADGREQWRSM